ncbi:MAG: XRE family transcriptional regulator [Methylicorpusculum sp.]|uniref:XRE family transcriptional regulator n=1 Tax=Methylicorpusculum sp. TaxID=2713644 RepID=UPI00271682F2|nr:XRE family transcriptional regulator [Methylicorpusculum sp.]MDO8940856.1 XRE family transcriptional regulator [Methylicorpusculum sp.]MDP2202452.1 XRE family transcriptional regulator [Methylicorpusculum sp.]
MKISDRLKQIRDRFNLSQPAAAAKFNIVAGTWKQYERGPSEPGSGALRNLAEGGINIHWLLTGEGEMLLEDVKVLPKALEIRTNRILADAGDPAAKDYFQQVGKNIDDKELAAETVLQAILNDAEIEVPEMLFNTFKHLIYLDNVAQYAVKESLEELKVYIDQLALIPFYDVQASAGAGSLVDNEQQISQMAFRKDWLKQKGLQASHCALIKAKGDSMEPTIHDGDLLLVDTSIDSIKDDAIYIVQADHHLIVKRLQQSLDGSLTIISDNQRYEKQTIGPEQAKTVKIAGRVKWYGHEI